MTILSDYKRGYNYASERFSCLTEIMSAPDILELAEVFAETEGENAELARGIAAYFAEAAQRVKGGGACG